MIGLFLGFELMGNEEIVIENKIKVGDELKIYAPNIEDEINWKLISRPVFSKIDINSRLKQVEFIPDIVGEYKIRLNSNDSENNKNVYVFKEIKEKEKEMQAIIMELYKNKNIIELEYSVEINKKNYPKSIYLLENFYQIINLARELKKMEIEKKYLKYICNEYKMLPETKYMVLERLYEISEMLELNSGQNYLKKIALNNEFYNEKLIKSNLEKSLNKEKEIKIIINEYSKKLKIELGELVGDYYNENGDKQNAIKYYKMSNNLKIAKIYLESNEEEKLKEIEEQLSNVEKEEIKKIEEQKEKLKTENDYYKKASESLENNKFNISKLYYSQIIKKSENRELVKKAYYSLSKVYSLTNEYQKSKEYLEEYIAKYANIKDVKAYYDLALLNYNMENFDEAKGEFDRILKLYPYTIWETKAKIYMLKIKKMRGDLS